MYWKLTDKEFDKLFRKAAYIPIMPFNELAWYKMKKILDSFFVGKKLNKSNKR